MDRRRLGNARFIGARFSEFRGALCAEAYDLLLLGIAPQRACTYRDSPWRWVKVKFGPYFPTATMPADGTLVCRAGEIENPGFVRRHIEEDIISFTLLGIVRDLIVIPFLKAMARIFLTGFPPIDGGILTIALLPCSR